MQSHWGQCLQSEAYTWPRETEAQGPGFAPGLWGLNSGARSGWDPGSSCLVLWAKAELPRGHNPWDSSRAPCGLQPCSPSCPRVIQLAEEQQQGWGPCGGLPGWVGPGVHRGCGFWKLSAQAGAGVPSAWSDP